MSASKRPRRCRLATEDEIAELGGRESQWEFPHELFDGQWYRLSPPTPDSVLSMTTNYRKRAANRYGRRAKTYRKDGFVYVRTTEEITEGAK